MKKEALDKAIAEYKAVMQKLGHFARAEKEADIWHMVERVYGDECPDREAWMVETFGMPPKVERIHDTLLRAGEWTSLLWQRLDDGAAPSTVNRVYTAVVKRHRLAGGKKEELLAELLAIIDKLIYARGPKAARTLETMDAWSTGEEPEVLLRGVEAPKPSRSPRHTPTPRSASSAAGRKDAIRQAVEQKLEPYFEALEVPEPFRVRLAEGLLVELQMMLDDFEIASLRSKKEPLRVSVSERQFRNAADVLGVKAVWGRSLDLLSIRRIGAKRKAPFHPDRTGGEWKDDQQRESYEAIEKALEVLESYQRQVFGAREENDDDDDNDE